MATKPSVKLYLALGGQQEFRTRLQACQKEVKTFQTELKTLATQYDGNANHIDALTKKQKVLEGEYEALQRKQKVASDALQESQQDYDKCSKNLENLKDKLTLATDEHERLRKSVSGIDEYRKLSAEIESQENSLKDYQLSLKNARDALDKLEAEGKEGTDEWKAQKKAVEELEGAVDKLSDELDQNKTAQTNLYNANKDSIKAYEDQEAKIAKLELAIEKENSQIAECEKRTANWNLELAKGEQELARVDGEIQKNRQYIDEAKNSYDHCATSIDGMGNEVNETKGDLAGMEESVKGVSDELDELGRDGKLDGLGKSIVNYQILANVLLEALREIPRLIGQGVEFAIDVGSSFESQMSKVSAISGATGSDLAALTEKAAEMGRTTKFTAAEAGEGLEYMAMAGWKTQDMLDGLEGIMSLAAASGESLGTTSDIVTDALTAFGLSAKDSSHFADMMAAASSNANTNVSMMGETFKYVAPVAGALGYTAEDTSIAIGLMANAGIKASQAGTSLRTGLSNLVKPGKSAAEAMDQYNISITDSNGKMLTFREMMLQLRDKLGGLDEAQKAAAASAIFGKNAMSGWLAVINSSDEDFDKLAAAIDNCDGSASSMASTMQNNLSGALTIFNSALEGLGIAIYDKVAGPLTDLVNFGTDLLTALTGWVEPAKSDLEVYIDSVKSANAQVKQELESIESQLQESLQETSTLESYKSMFQDVLSNGEKLSSLSISDMVTAMVSDTGHLMENGIGVLDEGFLRAIQDVGGLKESDILGGTLESSAEGAAGEVKGIGDASDEAGSQVDGLSGKVASAFEGTSESAGETSANISGMGQSIVDMFTGVDTKAEGSSAKIKEFFAPVADQDTFWISIDSINGQMKVFTDKEKEAAQAKGELLGSTNIQVDHSFRDTLEEMGDSLDNIVVITDDFQKKQITKAIEHIAKLKPEAKDLWNEQYGILNNNYGILEQIINLEESYLKKQAFAKARSAYYEEMADAYVNLYQAESGARNLLDEINKGLENTGHDTYENLDQLKAAAQDASTTVGALTGTIADMFLNTVDPTLANIWKEYGAAISDAAKNVDDANGVIDTCKTNIQGLTEAEQLMIEESGFSAEAIDSMGQSVDGAGTSAEQAAQNLENLSEEEDDTAEAAEDSAEATEEMSKAMQNAVEEGIKNEKKALEELGKEYQNLRDEMDKTLDSKLSMEEKWTYGALGEDEEAPNLGNMASTLQDNLAQLQQWKADIERLSTQVGKGISTDFFSYILEQGPEYGKVLREMVTDLDTTGGQSLFNLSKAFDSVNVSEAKMSNYFSTLKLTLQQQLNEVTEGLDYSGFWSSIREGLETAEGWQNLMDTEWDAALEDALRAAQAIGAGIPEKLAEGINAGEISPAQAVDVINSSIRERLEGLASFASENGVIIPREIAEGIYSGNVDVYEAFNAILDGLQDQTGLHVQGHEIGSYILGSVAEAMDESAPASMEIYDSYGNVIDTATEKVAETVDASPIGESLASSAKDGIAKGKSEVEGEAVNMVEDSADKAEGKATEFKAAGEQATKSMADGVKAKQSELTGAVKTVLDAGIKTANGFNKDFTQNGNQIPGWIGDGAKQKSQDLSSKLSEVMRAGSDSIRNSMGDFTARGGEIPSAIGNGVASAQGNLATALNNAIAYAKYNLDMSGWDYVGLQIDNGVAAGIVNNQSAVVIAAQNMAVNAYNAATQALQIQSPSKLFRDKVGAMITKGTALGIADEEFILVDSVRDTLSTAIAEAESFVADNTIKLTLVADADTSAFTSGSLPIAEAEYKLDTSAASSKLEELELASDFGESAMEDYRTMTELSGAISENTRAVERLVSCATLLLNAAKTMSEKVGVTVINEIDGTQFDSRIRSVSQKAINQRNKQLAYAGGR